MRTLLILALSVTSLNAFAAVRALELTPLKPAKDRVQQNVPSRNIARVSATLISSADDQVMDSISAVVGDCASCVRGIAVKGVLGIRFEGNSRDSLRIMKKSAAGVRYRDCKQLQLPKSGAYECTFSFGNATYTVRLVSQPTLKK